MGTKYTSLTLANYNSAPPEDNASTGASNQLSWAKHISKIGNPLKVLSEAINSALVTTFSTACRSITASDSTVAGDHWKTVQIAATVTTAITVSLADAATMATGYIVSVTNQCAINQTIACATASNTIDTTTNNITIVPLESITFIVNAVASGYIIVSRNGRAITVGSITGLGTGVATALAIAIGSAGAPVLFNGAGGTPTSLVGTNITGTAAGLTAGAVTTNANLTGPITSTGNATAVAAQTGTGSTFVMQASPTLVTPTLGVALATSINGNVFTTGSSTYTGTAGQTYTFPTTSATIARTDAANTFTGVQTMTSPAITTPAITGLATGTGVATANTASTLVARDASGNFAAGTITASLTGNASGTAATVTGAAQTAITSVGTLTSLAVTGTVSGAGATFTTGAFSSTLNVVGNFTGTTGSYSSYLAVGSLIVNDPGAAYYTFVSRIGGTLGTSAGVSIGSGGAAAPLNGLLVGGNVSIGLTDTAAARLVVGETANTSAFKYTSFYSNAIESGSITRVGTTAAVTFNTSSDADLKNVFGDADRQAASARIMAYRMRDYEFKSHSGLRFVGPVAQDTYTVNRDPMLVTPGTDTSAWQINMSGFIPDLIMHVQNLQAQVDELAGGKVLTNKPPVFTLAQIAKMEKDFAPVQAASNKARVAREAYQDKSRADTKAAAEKAEKDEAERKANELLPIPTAPDLIIPGQVA